MSLHLITNDRIWTKNLSLTVAKVTLGALALALLSQIKIYLPGNPIPITLQVLVVITLGGLLGAQLAVAAVAEYLALGLCGLPVFAGGLSGVAILTGTHGGYFVGFLAAAALCGMIFRRFAGRAYGVRLFGAMLAGSVGVIVIYASGWLWLAASTHMTLHQAYLLGVVPFLLGDIQKVYLAATLLALRNKSAA